jgi:large subunit ribosomal protein L29
MKGVRAKDLRGNDPEELRRTVRKLEEDLFKHRLKQNTNQLENTMLIRNTRRDIARVNTVPRRALAHHRRRDSGAGVRSGRGPGLVDQDEARREEADPGTGDVKCPVTKSTSAA